MEKEELMSNILVRFKEDLLADGKSTATIKSYVGDISAFLDWLEDKGVEFHGQLHRVHATSYRKFLVEAEYQSSTINKKINSLSSFNSCLIEQGLTQEKAVDPRRDRVKVAHGSEKEVQVFTEDEVEKMLFHVADTRKVNQRDKLIVLLLLYTGIRASELVALRLTDLDLVGMNLTVAWGKGGKRREVPLKGEVVEVIREYLNGERKLNQAADSKFLIVTQRAAKMNRDSLNKVLKRISLETGIQAHPHKFRRTFCTRLLAKAHVPLTTVSALVGHSSVQTTASYYVNTSRKDKASAIELL